MPGAITHLAIANKILELLPVGTVKNEALFYAGSIAPDAIHAKKNYKREFKKQTHMRENISDREFHLDSNLELFYSNVKRFIESYINKGNEDDELYLGYLVHVLSDALFMLTVRKEYSEQMTILGINQLDKSFRNYILEDLKRNDYMLIENYKGMQAIGLLLMNMVPYEIEGLLTQEELNISRNWVCKEFFINEPKITEPKYISYDRINKYIEYTANDIVGGLIREKIIIAT